MSRLGVILVLLFLVACKGNEEKNEVFEKSISKRVQLIEKEDIKSINYLDYSLDQKIKNELSTWLQYNQVENIIDEIKKADLSFFKGDKEVVKTTIKEFEETMPDQIKTDAVQARALVVKNMYLRLHNIINLDTSTKEDLKKGIKDLLVAFSNFNFQVNKKYERDAQIIIKP